MPDQTTQLSNDMHAPHRRDSRERLPLSSQLRGLLKAKRQSLSLSVTSTAKLLGVHATTFHNWESGKNHLVSHSKIDVMMDFIEGRYDSYVKESEVCASCSQAGADCLIRLVQADTALGRVLRQISDTYLLLDGNAKSRRIFLEQLDSVVDSTLAMLGSKKPSHSQRQEESEGC